MLYRHETVVYRTRHGREHDRAVVRRIVEHGFAHIGEFGQLLDMECPDCRGNGRMLAQHHDHWRRDVWCTCETCDGAGVVETPMEDE